MALRDEHRMRLYNLAEAAAKAPMRAVDSFALLFNRPIGEHNQGLATGEASGEVCHSAGMLADVSNMKKASPPSPSFIE